MRKPGWVDAQSQGNGCLGVIVDSTAPEDWKAVEPAVFSALGHQGLPYRVLDLGKGRLPVDGLSDFRGLLFAQAHLGGRLVEAEAAAIREAVHGGVGLVCFDGDVDAYPAAIQEVFGVTGKCPTFGRTQVRISAASHFITSTREVGETVVFDQAVPVSRLENPGYAYADHCLLRTEDGWPALVVKEYGQGRVVLWTLSPLVWTREYLGHAMGLDDLFWKGIVWAARKPFVMKAMPPMMTFMLDDASSSYNHFRYLDVFNDHGFIPHVGVYLDDVDKVMHDVKGQDSQALRAKYEAGVITVAAHGFTYNHQIYFDHEKRKPWPDEVIAENFRKFDQKLEEWGIQHSRLLNAHFGEVGYNALPYLLERGIDLYATIHPFNQTWFEPEATRRTWENPSPYDYVGFVYDAMPDRPEFFAISAMVHPRRFTGAPMVSSEFLWGNTIFWDEHPAGNDLQAAANQALVQLRRGLDSLFFAELMTHEQRIAVLSMSELDEILSLVDRGLAKYSFLHRSYEYIGEYARCKVNSHLAAVNVDAGGQVTADLTGKTSMTTSLYVFREEAAATRQIFLDIPPFTGSARVVSG